MLIVSPLTSSIPGRPVVERAVMDKISASGNAGARFGGHRYDGGRF
jgi:hypothetical protein